MKCLVITPYFPPEVGGACRMLGGIADSLAAEGHSVTVLAFGSGSAIEKQHDDAANYNVRRVHAQWQNLKTVTAMGGTLGRLVARSRFDLIFCGTAYSSAALAYLATRLRATPYVVYSHGEDVAIVADSTWKRLLLKRALQGSKHTFANSAFTQEALTRAGAVDVETLHPSINAAPYLATTDERAERFAIFAGLSGRTENLLITVARLQERKGHDVVIRALPMIACQVRNVHYLIVGKGDQGRILDLAQELGVRDRVTIMESLSESDLAGAYRASTLHVLVSRADANSEVEGFGTVYLEAGAAGRPSVAGDHGGAPEAVIDGVTGVLVDPTSAEETARVIVQLLQDDVRRVAMGDAARKRTVETFDDSLFLNRIREVCSQHSRIQ